MIVQSDEFIEKLITWGTKNNSPKLKEFWLLSDFAHGRKVDPVIIIKILESFDQEKENVKILRRELGL